MKKLMCVLLSVIMAFGMLTVCAGAAENIIPVHYVCLDENAVGYVLIPLNEDGKYNSTYTEEDDDVENGLFYIPDDGTIRFVVEYVDGYDENFMVTVRYIATNRFVGSFNGDPALAENASVLLTQILKDADTAFNTMRTRLGEKFDYFCAYGDIYGLRGQTMPNPYKK